MIMKNTIKFLALSLCAVSCTLDNYEQPNASLYGRVVDFETGEPILQDIVNGSQIQIVQLGYSDQEDSPRYLNFKFDGSYCENNLFKGTYEISVLKSNFGTLKDTIEISGPTKYDIKAKPNVNIENVEYNYDAAEGELTATFNLKSAGNYALRNIAIVGGRTSNATTMGIRTFAVTSGDCAGPVDPERRYSLTMFSDAVEDGDYYLRIAAETEASDQFNYSETVEQYTLNSALVKEKGLLFDNCDNIEGWQVGKLDKNIKRKGDACITNTGNPTSGGPCYFQKKYDVPFDTQCEFDNCVFSFYLYVDTKDIAAFNKAKKGQIEIGSAGTKDKDELTFYWQHAGGLVTMPDLSLGWNKVELPCVGVDFKGEPAKVRMNRGTVDFSKLNWIRVYLEKGNYGGEVTLKIDQIRVYDKTKEY